MPDKNPETSQPAKDITLSDGTQLETWQDETVAKLVDGMPLDERTMWAGARPNLSDLLRPGGFNGSVLGIRLTPMEQPKGELLEVLNLPNASQLIAPDYCKVRRADVSRAEPSNIVGFWVTARASSSAQGHVGDINSAIWLVRKDGRTPDVYRVVLEPVTDNDAFDKLRRQSRHVWRKVMEHSLENPYGGGGASGVGGGHTRDRDYIRAKDLKHLRRPPSPNLNDDE